MTSFARPATSLIVSLAVILAPWPAWGQTVRVVAPLSAAGASAASAAGTWSLPYAPPALLAPGFAPLSAPSLQVIGAPVPLERAALLILETDRKYYEPYWVSLDTFVNALSSLRDAEGKPAGGLVLIQSKASVPASKPATKK